MRFDKAALEALDEDFTEEEKRYLLAKFFPKTGPAPWQNALRKGWYDWKQPRSGSDHRNTLIHTDKVVK
jgi:hypothetical protein